MAQVKDVKIRIRRKTGRMPIYSVILTGPDGARHMPCLFDTAGKPLRPAPTADVKTVDGVSVIYGEDPLVIAKVQHAAALRAAEGIDCGGLKYSAAMKLYLEWREENGKDSKFHSHAAHSVRAFGEKTVTALKHSDVHAWVQSMLHCSDVTIHHRVQAGRATINWLSKTGRYKGNNPFEGHEWKARGVGRKQKAIIAQGEWQLILNITADDPRLYQAVMLGYYTGLRPSEIYRIQPEDFRHDELTLEVQVKKTGDYRRLVSIPRCLSVWALNWKWYDLVQSTIEGKMLLLKEQHPTLSYLSMGSFRLNYGIMMERAGATVDAINAHQSEKQYKTRIKHYLGKDDFRAVTLMSEYVEKVFSEHGDFVRHLCANNLRG